MNNPAALLQTPAQRQSVESIRDLYGDGMFYSMDSTADLRLDDFLAAGISDAQGLADSICKILLNAPPLLKLDFGGGCSAFLVRSPEGHLLVGRNYDFRHDNPVLLLTTHAPGACRTVGMSDLGWMKVTRGQLSDGTHDNSAAVGFPYILMDGMNEHGLMICILALVPASTDQDRGRTKITASVAVRMVLERAKTVEEAIALFDQYDMTSIIKREKDPMDFHFFLADRSGRAVVLEYCDQVLCVNEADHVTNFYITPRMFREGGGKERYNVIDAVLEYKEGVMDAREVMELLRLVSQPSPQRRKGKSDTRWSAVYDLTAGTVTVAADHRYDRPMTFALPQE